MTLSVRTSTPTVPNLSAPPVMPAGKGGDAVIGNNGFGDMLDKLAQGTAAQGDAPKANGASATGCADDEGDADESLPTDLTMLGLMGDWSQAVATPAAGSPATPKAAKRSAGDEAQARPPQTGAPDQDASNAAVMLLTAIATSPVQPSVSATPAVVAKDGSNDGDPVTDALSGKRVQGDLSADGSTIAGRVAAHSAERQPDAAHEKAHAGIHAASESGNDKNASATAETSTDVANAAALAAKLAAAAGATPAPARVSVDPKAAQRADARQAAAKATAPTVTPVVAGDATMLSVPTTITAPGAATSDARQHTGERSSTGRAPAPSIAAQAHATTFEGAIRATSIDPAARSSSTGAGTISSGATSDRTLVDNGVPQQIVQAIRMQWNQGVGTARVTLQPDYLGNLSINIKVDNGAVTAVLDASNASVRQWIEGHEPMLRQALADQGLTLDRLVVQDDQPPSSTAGDEGGQGQQEQPRRRRQRAAPTDQTFEVVM